MKNDQIIRVNDKVKIINPDVLDRVGYPLTTSLILIRERHFEDRKEIDELLAKFNIRNTKTHDREYNYTRNTVAKAIANALLSQEGWGGNERKIYTNRDEDLQNAEATVIDRKLYKTGTRFAPWSSYDAWNGDWDYTPGGLDDEKTHVFFRLQINSIERKIGDICDMIRTWAYEDQPKTRGTWIEKTNLEKLFPKKVLS